MTIYGHQGSEELHHQPPSHHAPPPNGRYEVAGTTATPPGPFTNLQTAYHFVRENFPHTGGQVTITFHPAGS